LSEFLCFARYFRCLDKSVRAKRTAPTDMPSSNPELPASGTEGPAFVLWVSDRKTPNVARTIVVL
jgi:hypothetical protein